MKGMLLVCFCRVLVIRCILNIFGEYAGSMQSLRTNLLYIFGNSIVSIIVRTDLMLMPRPAIQKLKVASQNRMKGILPIGISPASILPVPSRATVGTLVPVRKRQAEIVPTFHVCQFLTKTEDAEKFIDKFVGNL